MASAPRVIEVNSRLMGDLIPLLLKRATGTNIPQALVTIAAGETPDLVVPPRECHQLRDPAADGRNSQR